MIFGTDLLAEVILGLGLALFAASALVLVRPTVERWRGRPPPPKPTSVARVVINLFVGLFVAAWGLATLMWR